MAPKKDTFAIELHNCDHVLIKENRLRNAIFDVKSELKEEKM